MTTEMISEITAYLKELWSPEQISGALKSDIKETLSVSHESIYKCIWKNKAKGGELYKYLRRKAKKYHSRCKERLAGHGYIKDKVGIEKRSSIIDDKSRVGDWEIDLVIDRKRSQWRITYYC